MRIQGMFTAAKLLALVAVVIAGVVHIAGGQNTLSYNKH
jgi:type IV secretory pathway VirB2 component (pilin)